MVSRSPRGAFASRIALVLALSTLLLFATAATAAALVLPSGPGAIRGTVTAANGGAALTGIKVTLYVPVGPSSWAASWPVVYTDPAGYYEFPVVAVGTDYRIQAEDLPAGTYARAAYTAPASPLKSFIYDASPVNVADGMYTTCDIRMRDSITFSVKPVHKGTTTPALANMWVTWELQDEASHPSASKYTGSDGLQAVLKGMPGGTYQIGISDGTNTYASSWYRGLAGTYDYVIADGGTADLLIEMPLLPTLTPAVSEGWQKGPVVFGFTQYDPDSIVNYSTYDADGSSLTWSFGDTVTFSTEGTHTASGWCRTTSGLDGLVNEKKVRIDNTPPETSSNADGGNHATLDLAYSDALSGVAEARYTLDGGPPTLYTGPVALARGVHSVTWWSQDNAGNIEDAHTGTIVNGPQASVSTPKGSSKTKVRRTLTFSGKLSRAANHRRLTLLAYRFNGADWVLARTKAVTTHTPRRRGMTTYRGSIKFTAKGSWKVIARYEGDGYWVQSYSAAKYVTVR
jgi:hypothetical protein